jgi:bifunctional non-homologous end joining protein LigD
MKKTLYCRQGSKDAVYVLELIAHGDKFDVVGHYGRRAGTLRLAQQNKSGPLDRYDAEVLFNRVLKSKLNESPPYFVGEDGADLQDPGEVRQAGVDGTLPGHMELKAITEEAAIKLISDDNYIAQPKADGVRCRLTREGRMVTGLSRTNKPITLPEPVIAAARLTNGEGFVADGELVGDVFVCFDILRITTKEMWRSPAMLRAGYIASFLPDLPGMRAIGMAWGKDAKGKLLRDEFKSGGEGLVFKNCLESYTAGESVNGLKLKFKSRASVIVRGVHKDGKGNSKSSFEYGLFDGTRLGTATVYPNQTMPPVGARVDLEYLYRHSDNGDLIQPVFIRVREDVLPEQCTAAQLHVKGAPRR